MWIIDKALIIVRESENKTILKSRLCEKLGNSIDATTTVISKLRRRNQVITVKINHADSLVICSEYAKLHSIEPASRQQYDLKHGRSTAKKEKRVTPALDSLWVIPAHRLQA